MKGYKLTEQSLGIFWHGEEVDGLLLYAFWPGLPEIEPLFPKGIWPPGIEVQRGRLSGEGWTVLMWDVRISQWPLKEQWGPLLEETLTSLCRMGAIVAWCGLEGHFADPPSLFDPEEMSESVYAYYIPQVGFRCAAWLGEKFATIGDDELLNLHRLVDAAMGTES
jgi:hypothetical protein